ncbi:unnamed protein product [Phytophthora lilii]|uniref:Unnamed protein product n=1 Tax=Phytophthora lilii TaxID=2077276 RepID=A0A9W6YLG5_9STRA|nr:unnamed protein product [Phytophthora lilii]
MPSQARLPSRSPIRKQATAFHLHSSPLRPTRARLSPPPPLFAAGTSRSVGPRYECAMVWILLVVLNSSVAILDSRSRQTARDRRGQREAQALRPAETAEAIMTPPAKRIKLRAVKIPPPTTDSSTMLGSSCSLKTIYKAATMQVRSLADFELSPDPDMDSSRSHATAGSSSQATTITEAPWSPAPSRSSLPCNPSVDDANAPQTETIAPWTPQRMNSREIEERYNIPGGSRMSLTPMIMTPTRWSSWSPTEERPRLSL